jgi:hypothetical protein
MPEAALTETITARGHENVTAEHTSTFEVTTDDYLTPAGDCILAIEADRAPAAFDPDFVDVCRDADATITITLAAAGHETTVTAAGHPDLSFESDRSAVVRTSSYVDERTVAIEADRAAADIDDAIVTALADGARLTTTLTVRC